MLRPISPLQTLAALMPAPVRHHPMNTAARWRSRINMSRLAQAGDISTASPAWACCAAR